MANKFTLKGHTVEVDYTIGGNPSFVALTFKDQATTKSFKPAEISTEQTGMGQLVSVALTLTVDTGATRFGFFLPQVNVSQGQPAKVGTVGIFEQTSGPDSIPHRPPTWHCVELSGTAENVIVPLALPVSA